MEEKNIVLEDVNFNEGMIIGVMVEGETLIMLKAFQKYLQEELDEDNENEDKISLSQTIQYILLHFLNETVSMP